LLDIHEYLLEKGVKLQGLQGIPYVYHDPCHSPLKQADAVKTVSALMGTSVIKSERCCGESGTLAVARPDISTQVRYRKVEELKENSLKLAANGYDGPLKMLTSCPSCLQGLQRYQGEIDDLQADYIVTEMARHILGKDWVNDYIKQVGDGGIERVLV
jgi:Fe-S oxidoreductase